MLGNLIPILFSNNLPPEYLVWSGRILADNGVIRDSALGKAVVNYYKPRLSNVKLMVLPEVGSVIRDASPHKFVTKLISNDVVPNNVSQTTAGSQPYLSGFIAPNERYAILNPNGGTKIMTHNAISFGASDTWTVSLMVNPNGVVPAIAASELCGRAGTGRLSLSISFNKYFFQNESGGADASTVISYLSAIAKNTFVQFVAEGNGTLKVFENGVLKGTLTVATNFIIITLLAGRNALYFNGKLHFYSIEATALSAAQCLADYNFWRSYIPEIETVQIGTQQWATSNLDMVTTPMGTAIPEVTDNAAWAALTTPAWCHYNNDSANGAIYGKLYNWYAVKQIQDDITAYNLANPTKPWGYHIPTQAEFTTLQTYLGGSSVAGGKMKVTGTTYWNTPNTGATNESGFCLLPLGQRATDGTFNFLFTRALIWAATSGISLRTTSSTTDATLVSSTSNIVGLGIRLIKD